MAVDSKVTLVHYALRKLGEPVIEINVDPDQLDDRVDEALEVYREFHSEATKKIYLKHEVTQLDIDNGYIPISPEVISVTKMFPVSKGFGGGTGMFDIKYQMMLNDMAFMGAYRMGNMVQFEQMQQHLSMIDMKLNGTPQVTYSRNEDRLYIHGELGTDIIVGDFVVVEAYEYLEGTQIYNDMWVKKYTTALIKRQWGANLMKFEGMQLPGGVTLNGAQLYQDAIAEIERLEEEIRSTFELPIDFLVG